MSNTSPTAGFSALPRNDQLFLGASVLAFICTFLPFDGISFEGQSASENAWHGIGFLACLFVLIALVAAVAGAFAASSLPDLPVSLNLIEAAAMALAVLFFVIRWLTLGSVFTVKLHLHWGGYVILVVTIVGTVLGVLRMKAAGESMPWENRGGAATPPAPPAA